MEREGGDGEATRDEYLTALDYTRRYMGVLESEVFWNEVNKGEYSVKTKFKKDDHGNNVMSYVEIRDKGGRILFMEDIGALMESSEEFRNHSSSHKGDA